MRTNRKWIIRGVVALAGLVLVCGAAAQDPVMDLNSLQQYYQGVTFDHDGHVDYAGDCVSCHHHTTGEAPVNARCLNCHDGGLRGANTAVSCRDCHSAEPYTAAQLRAKEEAIQYHNDTPGLKAAYHRSCMGCHAEVGAPMGCQDCHSRSDAGDSLYRTGAYLPSPTAGKGH
jgi:hypothetical protein